MAETWLCQRVEEIAEQVSLLTLTLDRLGIRLGRDAKLIGGNWEVSSNQIAQWVPGTTLPLGDTSEYVRFKDGNLEIRGGAFSIHTGESGAHMTMDAEDMYAYDTGGNETLHIDFETGAITITGTITATAGAIGGWTINATSLSKNNATLSSDGYLNLGTGDDVVKLDATDGTYRLWVGDATAGDAPFRVDKDGNLTAVAGLIGGWTISVTGISSLTGNAGIFLDPVSQLIDVGDFGGTYISINGAAGTVGTSDFGAGLSGWQVTAAGNAEFNNLTARGSIRTAVFEKSYVSSYAGSLLVSKSSAKLTQDYTVGGDLYVETPQSGGWVFETGDIVRVKGTDTGAQNSDTWVVVTRTATTNVYTTVHQYGDAGVTIHKGHAALDYGASGQGSVFITCDAANAPYLDIQTHAGSPWTTITSKARLGNLAGITDSKFGALTGYGLWTDSGYFTGSVKATAGELGTLDVSGTLSVGTGGVIKSGATNYGAGTGWWLDYNGGTPRFYIGAAAGNQLTWDGTTLSLTGTIVAQDGSLTNLDIAGLLTMGAGGEIRVGDTGTPGSNFNGIRLYKTSAPAYRLEGQKAGAVQFYVDNTGILRSAGAVAGNYIAMEADGLWVRSTGAGDTYNMKFRNSDVTTDTSYVGFLTSADDDPDAGGRGTMEIGAWYDANNLSELMVWKDWFQVAIYSSSTWYFPLQVTKEATKVMQSFTIEGNKNSNKYYKMQNYANTGYTTMYASGSAFHFDLPPKGSSQMRIYSKQDAATDEVLHLESDYSTQWFNFGNWLADGTIQYKGNLQPYRNSTYYTAYPVVPLTTALTSTSWDGDAKAADSDGTIDLSAVFGAPAGIKAALVRLLIKDETPGVAAGVGPSSSQIYLTGRTQVANQYVECFGLVPCDANGDLYWYIDGEIDNAIIQICGYCI